MSSRCGTHALAILFLLLFGLGPAAPTHDRVAVFYDGPPPPASTPAHAGRMPAIPVFPAEDYNLVPRTSAGDGEAVENVYLQGGLSVPAQYVRALDYGIPDPTLRDAFNVAMSFDPEFHQTIAAPFVYDGTWVLWDPSNLLAGKSWGIALPQAHLILVNAALKEENAYTLAAVVAHEAYHIVFNDETKRGPECIEAEINAHMWEAHVWNRVSRHALLKEIARTGQPSRIQLQEIALAKAADEGTIGAYVAHTYRDVCAARD